MHRLVCLSYLTPLPASNTADSLWFGSLRTFWLITVLCPVVFSTANPDSQAKTNSIPQKSNQKMRKVRVTICPCHWETT